MEKPNPKCNQCNDNSVTQRIDGVFALTKIEKNKEQGGITFMPASGLPVVVFICPNCGELKIYPAKLFNEI